jgi:hypothetical protein
LTGVFLEGAARPIVVGHAVLGAALVAASTHHLMWCRRYLGGRFQRVVAERRFALIAVILYATNFAVGASLYPTYKTRVRAEYFDKQSAVIDEIQLRARNRLGEPAAPPRTNSLLRVSRGFDIKEHLALLGLGCALALFALSRRAHPSVAPSLAPLYVGLSALMATTAWTVALLGLYTATWRAVGPPA